jgi:hypothetical protein
MQITTLALMPFLFIVMVSVAFLLLSRSETLRITLPFVLHDCQMWSVTLKEEHNTSSDEYIWIK